MCKNNFICNTMQYTSMCSGNPKIVGEEDIQQKLYVLVLGVLMNSF